MIYVYLFVEFFKIGLFAVGGGLATLPFLYALSDKYHWFSATDLPNMIAISQATPGPIGINMATYAGFMTSGILGSLISTLGLITPSIIIILILARFLDKFNENTFVQSIFYGLRPAVIALIALSGFEVIKVSIIDFKTLIIFIVFSIGIAKMKFHPIFFILIGALLGVLLNF